MKPRTAALSLVVLLAAACARSPAAPSDSGIQGVVTIGPTCPVERADSPCPDQPFAAEIAVKRGDEVVATVSSGEDGRFRVALAPGDYLLQGIAPNQGGLPFAKPIPVTVRPHEFADVRVTFDSGIR